MKTTILALLVLMIAVPAVGASAREPKQPTTRRSEPRAALLAVLDVERQSQAYYRAVLNKHRPFHPFGMVYRVEQRHEQVLVDELNRHAVTVPEDRSQEATVAVPEERDAALAKAVQLEKETVAAYDKAIKKVRSSDLRQTLEQLRAESADHQKWFADPDTCPMGGKGRGGMGRRGT
jgi:hypothetical protein